MTLLFFEVFSTKHLFYSIAGISKMAFLNASTASSGDRNL
ncbi:unnamed protein product [Acanthoscelides obtectus]|uniref:Uncharacterized protein n=1 Tax=Acanthoscelides obtectus TaxID=200917 RepID=A0A9P0KCH6_ACAOB|nr:unnamed protein product [Acanthoscelides obtectus]CAK1625588.1 hypothetical protein AOBTE_LOCUS3249 [Acanthoscelides obtectus]